ncbi:GAF domain-containing protein [Spiractinospora alimapuensis]|uniref:helix-turn-helix domain-containing protein n=1 Tax=Spiractinospora alimapuensis TaxID=2820884 RepID=UPI001F392C28|nr:helix-turn-helix domain-containing protein [Spiractinospora alimapuensis]QVQ52708.1 GAF domain-containing protein [Spiractinospora alimapuensis]
MPHDPESRTADLIHRMRVLARTHDATMSGRTPPVAPRRVIAESWTRLRRAGLDPERGADPDPWPADVVEARRRASPLSGTVREVLSDGLLSLAQDAGYVHAIVDGEGRVLWREGGTTAQRRADALGLIAGACWTEERVGTNAIGTALARGRPVQVHSAEHFVRTHHAWTCAAAPIHDPRDGSLLGVTDLSGPAMSVHPSMLALVTTVARLAEAKLRDRHRDALEQLRSTATPLLSRLNEVAVVTDPHGWVAASIGMPPTPRLRLPDHPADHAWVPTLGTCSIEPVPGGLLVRRRDTDEPREPARVQLDLSDPHRPVLTVHRGVASWTHQLTPRHSTLLELLAHHRAGLSAADLAEGLFHDRGRTITVRAELSRLRRRVGDLLEHRPYRFAANDEVTVRR